MEVRQLLETVSFDDPRFEQYGVYHVSDLIIAMYPDAGQVYPQPNEEEAAWEVTFMSTLYGPIDPPYPLYPTFSMEDEDERADFYLKNKPEPLPNVIDEIVDAEEYLEDDKVYLPAHYTQYEIEPITFIMQNDLPFWMSSVIKYVMRAGSKQYDDLTMAESELRDLGKAERYIEMRRNQLAGKEVL
jgi:hypothetical protein